MHTKFSSCDVVLVDDLALNRKLVDCLGYLPVTHLDIAYDVYIELACFCALYNSLGCYVMHFVLCKRNDLPRVIIIFYFFFDLESLC